MARRLLTLRALGLGDLLTAVPALRALARAHPDHERCLAAPSSLAPLVARIDADGAPAVDRLIPAGPLEPLPGCLAPVDVAVNLHGAGPESHRVLQALTPRRTIWFANPEVVASREAPRWRAGEHEVARWCRLLGEHDIECDPSDLELTVPRGRMSARAEGAVLVHPGAASPARRWPPERFAAVARACGRQGERVLITGSANERAVAESVARAAGLTADSVLAGETDLLALAQAVAAAKQVICGDTGVGHLATALMIPSVLLFGPTPPSRWGPFVDGGRHRVLWSGQTGDPHGARVDPGLLTITVADVLQAVTGLAAPGRHSGSAC